MKESTQSPPEKETITQGHETDAVNSRFLIFSGISIAVLMAFSFLLAYVLIGVWNEEAANRPQLPRRAERPRQTGGVRFTANQPEQLEELRQAEKQKLSQYEWIDRPEGIARIPIERAIDILATNGLPKKMLEPEKDDANTPSNE